MTESFRRAATYNLGFLIAFSRGIIEQADNGRISAVQALAEIEKQLDRVEARYMVD